MVYQAAQTADDTSEQVPAVSEQAPEIKDQEDLKNAEDELNDLDVDELDTSELDQLEKEL